MLNTSSSCTLSSEPPKEEEPAPTEKPIDDTAKNKKDEGRGRRPTKHSSLERKPGLPGRQRTRSESLTRKDTAVR